MTALQSIQINVPNINSGWTGCVLITWPDIRINVPNFEAFNSLNFCLVGTSTKLT